MLNGKRITVVLPAYNAAITLENTYRDIPHEVVDDILLVDDGSKDDTVAVARRLGLSVYVHSRNCGYGRNQKTCYSEASSINFRRSVVYGFGVLRTSLRYRLHTWKIRKCRLFDTRSQGLGSYYQAGDPQVRLSQPQFPQPDPGVSALAEGRVDLPPR